MTMNKEPLLLLHGAVGSSDQLRVLAERLKQDQPVYLLDFNGHGGNPFTGTEFSIAHFAEEVLNFMEEKNISKANIFGYSMGGYVGVYLAKKNPGKIMSVITLGTKFSWDEAIAKKESQLLDPEIIEAKVPGFAAELSKRHAPVDWKDLLNRTVRLLGAMGIDNPLKMDHYSSILQPICIMLGDRDKMVGLDETIEVYRRLPNAHLAVLPGTPHPIEKVDPEHLAFEITRFLGSC